MLLKRNMEGFVTNCLDYKSELVAAARRTHPIQKKRSPGERFWARFRSYDRATPMPPSSEWLVEAVSRWSGVRSQWILHNGPDPMTERQLGCLFTMMESWEPSNLVREVPEEECRSLTAYGAGYHDPSSRSLTAEERWGLIRDLCQKHRGEVREINGSWRYLSTPFPTEDKFFHAQYCLTYEEAKMRTPWTGKPASGGKGAGKPAYEENTFLMRDDSGAGHWLREATVTGLPELFSSFGNMATARELYEWWGQARVIVHKRVHGATHPARREAARRRYAATGHWGWGR